MIRTARAYARIGQWLGFAAGRRNRANRKHEALGGQENNSGVAMLMIGWTVRMVMVGCGIRTMVMVVYAALVMIAAAKLHVAGQRIGEMNVILRVVDAVHQRDVGLPRQHDGQRHAQYGDRASQRNKAVTIQQRLASGSPSRRKRWQFSTVQDPRNVRASFPRVGSAPESGRKANTPTDFQPLDPIERAGGGWPEASSKP
jgi:hypothetical protein